MSGCLTSSGMEGATGVRGRRRTRRSGLTGKCIAIRRGSASVLEEKGKWKQEAWSAASVARTPERRMGSGDGDSRHWTRVLAAIRPTCQAQTAPGLLRAWGLHVLLIGWRDTGTRYRRQCIIPLLHNVSRLPRRLSMLLVERRRRQRRYHAGVWPGDGGDDEALLECQYA